MKVKILFFLYLCIIFNNGFSQEINQFGPPSLTPEKALHYIERHLKKEKIDINKYSLKSYVYNYGAHEWLAIYENSSYEDKEPKKDLMVYLDDESPCEYNIEKQ